MVETSRGVEYGEVLMANKELPEEKIVMPLKEILRKATEEDRKQYEINHEKEREAYQICQKKIQEHALEMKLIDVEYTFDRGKALFLFYRGRKGGFPCFSEGSGSHFPYQNRASTGRSKR